MRRPTYFFLAIFFLSNVFLSSSDAFLFFGNKKESTEQPSEKTPDEAQKTKRLAEKVLSLQKQLLSEKVKRKSLEQKISEYEKSTPETSGNKSDNVSREAYLKSVQDSASAQLKIKNLEKELEKLQSDVKTLESERDSLKSSSKISSDDVVPKQKYLDAVLKQSALENKIKLLQDEASNKIPRAPSKELTELRAENKKLSDNIKEQSNKIDDLNAKLQEKSQRTGWNIFRRKDETETKEDTKNIEPELKSLKSQYALLKASSSLKERKLADRIKTLEDELKSMKEQSASILANSNAGSNEQIEKLKQLYDKIKVSYEELKQKSVQLEGENKSLLRKLESSPQDDKRLSEFKEKFKTVETNYKSLQELVKQGEAREKELQKQVELLQKDVRSKDDIILSLKNSESKSDSNATLESLKSEYAMLKSAYELEKNKYEKEMASQSSASAELQSQITSLNLHLQKLQTDKNLLESKLSQANKQVAESKIIPPAVQEPHPASTSSVQVSHTNVNSYIAGVEAKINSLFGDYDAFLNDFQTK